MKKLKVEKSMYPDDEGTHLVVLYSNTKYGRGFRRLLREVLKSVKSIKRN